MMWQRKRITMDTKITWRLMIIALSMIAASILAVSNVAQERAIESTNRPGVFDGGIVNPRAESDPICFSTAVFRICDEHGVPPKLVLAIIQVESQGNPKAVSRRGALGLMQLMPEMIRLYQLVDPFDPLANIEAGVRHLKYLLTEYSGNLSLTLAAYNAGPGAVRKYRGVPPYPETENYLRKVLHEYQREGNEWKFSVASRKVGMDPRDHIHEKKHLSQDPPQVFAFLLTPLPSARRVTIQ
jgi:soluble lytic murein transglycosylase-like protein